jgi:ABC-2 type transport system ATP-binding protein
VLHKPALIILDEPFSGLDPVNSNLIKDEIYALARQGASIIFSTHRMEQVEEICDHIILVNKGQKILDGTVSGVKQEFKANVFRIGFDGPLPSDPANEVFEVVERESSEGSGGSGGSGGSDGREGSGGSGGNGGGGGGGSGGGNGGSGGNEGSRGSGGSYLVVKIEKGHRTNDVLRYFIDRGIAITSFTEILPSLNDIFIQLVKGTPSARQFQSI